MVNVKLTPLSIYHPETDSQTGIVNKKLEEMLRCFVDESQINWDELLVDAEVAYNSATHSATTFSAYNINYGMHPRTIPMDIVTLQTLLQTIFLVLFKKRSAPHREQLLAHKDPWSTIQIAPNDLEASQ
jgi:hypothetical protein